MDGGKQFAAIAPLLWLESGAVGTWDEIAVTREPGYHFPDGAKYGVLFREARFGAFRQALTAKPDITHVYLVTDSEEAFAEMRAGLPKSIAARMLYRDYLRSFRVGGEAGKGGAA